MQPTEPSSPDKVRCPHCGTTRLRILTRIDRIEKLYGNKLLNKLRARRGDTLYHCIYCRLQFYDPRKPVRRQDAAEEQSPAPDASEAEVAAAAPKRPRPAAPKPEPPAADARAPQLLLGSSIAVRVSIRGGDDLYVDGTVEGSLTCRHRRVTIGPHGKVTAKVRAGDLEVYGHLLGDSQVEGKTILRQGASVTGDIRTAYIAIEDGAYFKGSVDLVRKPAQPGLRLAENEDTLWVSAAFSPD